jgi:thymidylate synthase
MKAQGSRLEGITRELWLQWEQTRATWRDARSQEFEQKYLVELMASVEKTVTVIDQLDKLIGKIKKDCE